CADVFPAAHPVLNRPCHTPSLVSLEGATAPSRASPQDYGGKAAARTSPHVPVRPRRLLDRDGRALLLELLLHIVGLGLGDPLLHRLGRAVHPILGLLEAQARELADDPYDPDL